MFFEVQVGDTEICAYAQGLIVADEDTGIVVNYQEGVEVTM